ncbi:MAG: Coenzyme F420 hydrogenase/dehydrogenase, beta subunit C-terminal domain [Clostridiales bacterium]|nr:Coenzyme F420 hydrogenase/dehydrogenase, beta subunit C-terminal domain [Clostridiales bacterium]
MSADREGFLYPEITDACVFCGHCTHICPSLKHRELRPDPTVFAVWSEDDALRQQSTSGGAFAAIASFILESGGVVFGAAMDSDMRVAHTAIQHKDDLPRLMGVKLVQSDMGECFQQVRYYLDRGRFVFFTGTPCQVDGLYKYLGEYPELLLTADILCNGVPSPGVWCKMVDAMRYIKQRRVKAVQFCKKVIGSESRFVVEFDGGRQYDAPLLKSDYGRGLFRGLFLRPACYHCTYCNTKRVADLTIGSFRGLPSDYKQEQQKLGISMLLINTVKGAHILDLVPLHREKRTLEEAKKDNPALSRVTSVPQERAAFFDAFVSQPFHKVYQRFFAISDWSYGVANGGKIRKFLCKFKSASKENKS